MPYVQYERRQLPATLHLIIINVIVYLGIMINERFMVSTFALFYPGTPWFKIWQPISYMFMHGGFWHLFFNMYSLFIFGMAVEKILGTKRYLILYFLFYSEPYPALFLELFYLVLSLLFIARIEFP